MKYKNDLAIIIVNRDRPDLTDTLVESLNSLHTKNGKDLYIIEMGSQKEKLSKYCSYYYEDTEFKGKAYGHNQGLNYVLENHGRYRYYWFLMNDLVFGENPNPIDKMIEILESERQMGILSPTEIDSGYPGSRPDANQKWHKVSTTDYLALMMKDRCLQDVGFLGPHFKYSWGAIHELTYKMYQKGWFIAYCDQVVMKHLGGTTYGSTKNTISRDEYKKNARMFCAKYFVETYGEDWDEKFTKCLPGDVETNTYKLHRKFWEMR
jgi:GT2 family glycosyltransferase